MLRFKVATPATNYSLRLQYEDALYTWATQQEGFVIIAGHSHRPVFSSETHAARLLEELNTLREQVKQAPSDAERASRQELANAKAAELHWVLARSDNPTLKAYEKPCYFNTGCCSFADGDITGLEIADGEIRLMRWPDERKPQKRVLRSVSLEKVFKAL